MPLALFVIKPHTFCVFHLHFNLLQTFGQLLISNIYCFFFTSFFAGPIESFLSLSPNYKQLPPLVVTPPTTIDEPFRYNDFMANRYRSDQQIYNFSYSDQPMSPNSQSHIMQQRRPHRQQQSFELSESNLAKRNNRFQTSKVKEDINLPSTSSSDRSTSDTIRIHSITNNNYDK